MRCHGGIQWIRARLPCRRMGVATARPSMSAWQRPSHARHPESGGLALRPLDEKNFQSQAAASSVVKHSGTTRVGSQPLELAKAELNHARRPIPPSPPQRRNQAPSTLPAHPAATPRNINLLLIGVSPALGYSGSEIHRGSPQKRHPPRTHHDHDLPSADLPFR